MGAVVNARDEAISELIEELRTRLFRADGIVSVTAALANEWANSGEIDGKKVCDLWQALTAASEIINDVTGKMEYGPFLRAVDEAARAAAASSPSRPEPLAAPASEDQEAQPPARRH